MIRGPAALVLAYADPGVGAMALQALLATIFGVLFHVTRAWKRVVAVARRISRRPPG